MLADHLGHFEHANLLLAAEDGLELVIGVDHTPVLRILQAFFLDIGPQFFDHLRSGQLLVADNGTKRSIRRQGPHEGGGGVAFYFLSRLFFLRPSSWLLSFV